MGDDAQPIIASPEPTEIPPEILGRLIVGGNAQAVRNAALDAIRDTKESWKDDRHELTALRALEQVKTAFLYRIGEL